METLHDLLAGAGEVGVRELRDALGDLCSDAKTARITAQQKLRRPHIYRIEIADDGVTRSVIVKRLSPEIAQRNERVVREWLPAVGLEDAGPPLLGVAAERTGQCVWHIYRDLGDCSLAGADPTDGVTELDVGFLSKPAFDSDPERLYDAVATIARIHARFAEHPLLAECRLFGRDLGSHLFTTTLRDGLLGLRALDAIGIKIPYERRVLLVRLRQRLELLLQEQPHRMQLLADFGGPATLLHGAISYDLSNFLAHFPRAERQSILDAYIRCLEELGWRFTPGADWNLLFDTAECARLANTVVWRVVALTKGQTDWPFDDLVLLDEWFDKLEPVLPPQTKEAVQ
ncbi:MAG: hypothetical protein DMG12_07705 [Acidobacteria bacterium]|nr:MAG: hypothetical protein DMG12_07705 [Acidobacteriota bacterium]